MANPILKKNVRVEEHGSEYEEVFKELCRSSPVDYSFTKIKSLKDFDNDHPREFRVGKAPERGPSGRFLSCSLWLSHSNLLDIEGFHAFVVKTFEQPKALAWLDLSSNYLSEIPKVLAEFPNLRILYLHNNIIEHLAYIKRLLPLKELFCLTLRGNPVENQIHYRNYILYFFPKLKKLDSIAVIASDRQAKPPPQAVLEEEEPTAFTGTEEEMLEFINS